MEIDQLKRGFWGYQKDSVYQLVSSMEDKFSTTLLEKEEEIKKKEEMYLSRIHTLENELLETKQKLENHVTHQDMISMTLLDAKRFAQTMQAEAEEKQKAEMEKFYEDLKQKKKELLHYQKSISDLREKVRETLNSMDMQIQGLTDTAEETMQSAPCGNMSLFERKSESGE